MSLPFKTASRSIKGARPYQEDAAVIWPDAHASDQSPPAGQLGAHTLIAVLADGMGGHTGGALASTTACTSFLHGYTTETATVRDRLRAGLFAANHSIERKVEEKPALSGMGSTLVGTAFTAAGLEWVSVGDSPLYLFRRGEIALLNEDHSLAPALDEMAATGKITAEQAKSDPRRHMLRSAVTGDELDLVDLSQKPLSLEDGDIILLASDGIHALQHDELARIIAAYAGDGPDAIADALIRGVEAIRDPHQDNTTVVVIAPDLIESTGHSSEQPSGTPT
ncbi:MAG: PP2C family protein-serine/threonine phosphatase [Hyphomicrobiaceae bacterium]